MKLSIAAYALSAATLAYGLYAPPQATKNYCLGVYPGEAGALQAGTCDATRNNKIKGLPILKNGCAADQISITATKHQGEKEFNIKLYPCLPPNVVQL